MFRLSSHLHHYMSWILSTFTLKFGRWYKILIYYSMKTYLGVMYFSCASCWNFKTGKIIHVIEYFYKIFNRRRYLPKTALTRHLWSWLLDKQIFHYWNSKNSSLKFLRRSKIYQHDWNTSCFPFVPFLSVKLLVAEEK